MWMGVLMDRLNTLCLDVVGHLGGEKLFLI
jgi:hypothetical protein